MHLHVEAQAQRRDPVGVQGMARPSGLLRIVADPGAFLPPIDRFDRGIHIENPRRAQKLPPTLPQMAGQPLPARDLIYAPQPAPHTVLAYQLAQPQQPRRHCVKAQRRQVGIAPMPR